MKRDKRTMKFVGSCVLFASFALTLPAALQAADFPPRPEWSELMPLPLIEPPQITPQMDAFVGSQVSGGQCPIPRPADGRYVIRLDIAVLVSPAGALRAMVPHAINCPTIEQYGVGLVTTFARNNLMQRAATADQWYRATLTFDWTE